VEFDTVGWRLVTPASMAFAYTDVFEEESPEAYERLLLVALRGDQTLFIRGDEVEQSWRIVDPIIGHWAAQLATCPCTRRVRGVRWTRTG
jgi:glucose-6-phosphate 1-dehydrogenase